MRRLFAALLLTLFSHFAPAEAPLSPAPLFAATLADLNDQPVALARYKGQPLVVNFWARWCGPCRAEIPELIRFRNQHKGKIEVLGIGIEDKAEPAKEFAKAYDMDYPVFIAKAQGIPLMRELGNSRGGLPYTLFINRHGQLVSKKMGLLKAADLEAVAPLLLAR